MCEIVGDYINKTLFSGYKVALRKYKKSNNPNIADIRYYSIATGIEYKAGKVKGNTVQKRPKEVEYFDPNLYHGSCFNKAFRGYTGVFVKRDDAIDFMRQVIPFVDTDKKDIMRDSNIPIGKNKELCLLYMQVSEELKNARFMNHPVIAGKKIEFICELKYRWYHGLTESGYMYTHVFDNAY